MSLDKVALQEKLKACIGQREQVQQMFYRLSGAVELLEEMIKALSEESEYSPESVKSEPKKT